MIHGVLIIASLIAAFPVLRVLSVSLRPGNNLLERNFQLIPEGATFDSYLHVLTETDLPQWLFNSLIITIGTSLVGLVFAATSAYAFSRFKFPGRGARPDHAAGHAAHPGHHAAGPDLHPAPTS